MYTVEILPYSIRAKGLNVFSFVISLALIFNQYINPIALEHLAWKYYVGFACLSSPYMLKDVLVDCVLLLAGIRAGLRLLLHRRDEESVARRDGCTV